MRIIIGTLTPPHVPQGSLTNEEGGQQEQRETHSFHQKTSNGPIK